MTDGRCAKLSMRSNNDREEMHRRIRIYLRSAPLRRGRGRNICWASVMNQRRQSGSASREKEIQIPRCGAVALAALRGERTGGMIVAAWLARHVRTSSCMDA